MSRSSKKRKGQAPSGKGRSPKGRGGSPKRKAPAAAAPPPSRGRGRLLLIGLAVVVLAGASIAAFLVLGSRAGSVTVPVPAELAVNHRQVQAYVNEHLARAREAPNDASRQATLGIVYVANGYWPTARECFENVARLAPDEPLAPLYVAIADDEAGRLPEAIEGYRAVTTRFPNCASAFYRLGDGLLRSGDLDGAEAAFRRLVALAPREWRGFAGLGEVNLGRGRFAEAAELLEKAVQLDPGAKAPRHQLGLAYRGLGRAEEAARELARGLDASKFPMLDAWNRDVPGHQKGLKQQMRNASVHLSRGNTERGLQILETAFQWHPDSLVLMSSLSLAYVRAGRNREALTLLRRILAEDDSRYRDHINLVACLVNLRRYDEALEHADRAIELVPDVARVHQARAQVLLQKRRNAGALASMLRAVDCDPGDPTVRLQTGDLLMSLGREAEAERHFRVATEKDPSSARAFRRLAEALLELGRPSEASDALRTARVLAPNDPSLPGIQSRIDRAVRGG